jgi:PAS domain S-box-containing protein
VPEALIEPEEWGRAPGPDIIVRADARGIILFVSASCDILGYEPADLVGRSGFDFVHPDDHERFRENTASIFRAYRDDQPRARVHRFLRKDGAWVWMRGNPRSFPSSGSPSPELLNFLEPISAEAAAQALSG